MENPTFVLPYLNLLVAFLGVCFVLFTIVEYKKLSKLRNDIDEIKVQLKNEVYRTQKAIQRVIASYSITDPDKKIDILNEAIRIDPKVFNAYNSLGYAYLEKKDVQKAIDAFREAINSHPQDKEGYFDIARAYYDLGDEDLPIKYLRQAIEIDPTSKKDLEKELGPIFDKIKDTSKFKELLH